MSTRGRSFICILLAFLSGAFVSCREADVPEGGERVRVDFLVAFPATRSGAVSDEDGVGSLDVLAFSSGSGVLEGHERLTGTDLTSISLELAKGVGFDWFVIANAPSGAFSSYTVKSLFTAGLCDGFTDGGRMLMYGSGSVPGVDAQGSPVHVSLDRYACKVSIGGLSVSWLDSFAAGSSVSLGRLALINVNATIPWSGVPSAGERWYNRMGIDAGLSSDVSVNVMHDFGEEEISSSQVVSLSKSFYCFPNPVSNNVNSLNTPQWSPRNTRLVLEIITDGVSNWYPVNLPSMECNTHYVIRNLDIAGPGSGHPDKPVERDDVSFSVEVLPWTDVDIPVDYTE